jgi:hypothetical protein
MFHLKKSHQNHSQKTETHIFAPWGCLGSGWSTIPHLFFAEDHCFKHLKESVN